MQERPPQANMKQAKPHLFSKARFLPLIFFLLSFLSVFPSLTSAAGCGSIPSSVSNYVTACYPFNAVNNQATATPSGFQLLLPNTPVNVIAGNVIVYNGISGALLESWAESYNTLWVNLGANVIHSSTSANGIYYLGTCVSCNFFTSNNPANDIGEAPQLSSSYAKYDNGNIVFNFYSNFFGTALSSQWTTSGTGTNTVNNGLTITGTNSPYGVTENQGFAIPNNVIFDEYGQPLTTGVAGSIRIGAVSSIVGFPSNIINYFSSVWLLSWSSSANPVTLTNQFSTTQNQVISTWEGPSTISEMTNYGTPTINSNSYAEFTTGYLSVGVDNNGDDQFLQWARVRAYPPGGTMPTILYGTAQNQVLPPLIWTAVCPGGVYSLPCTTTGNIVTYNNQLSASLWLNGALVGNTVTQESSTITGPGAYTYVFNTLGNGNYLTNNITYSFTQTAPPTAAIYLQNITANPAYAFPSLAGIPACTGNFLSGICVGLDVISGTNTLSSSLYVIGNIVVKSGSILTTNGFAIFSSGNFVSTGATLITGSSATVSIPGAGVAQSTSCTGNNGQPGGNIDSYGGSAGGGAGGGTLDSCASGTSNGGAGGNTVSSGGSAGTIGVNGGNGATPTPLAFTASNAMLLCSSQAMLAGAGGGAGGSGITTSGFGGFGGGANAGSFGLCIEATTLKLGTIQANSIATAQTPGGGSGTSSGGGSGGGGGGGSLILMYGSGGYTGGTYNVLGSVGVAGGGGGGGTGGTGGNGNILVENSQPIPIAPPVTFPFKLYSSTTSVTYTLNSVVGSTQTTLQGPTNTLAWEATNSIQPSDPYNFSVAEFNGFSTIVIPINLIVSMADFGSNLGSGGECSHIIQDAVNCANAPTWNGKPTQWNIQSDNPLNFYGGTNTTGGQNIDVWSNANLTFTPNIILTFGQFSPSITFSANLVNNPLIVPITQAPFGFISSTVFPTYSQWDQRRLFNTTTYDQQFQSPLNAITTTTFNWLYNNYSGTASVKEDTNITSVLGGNYALNTTYMANSLYANPPIILSNVSTLSTAASHYPTINNFFANTINYGTWPTYPIYLANNANSSLYTFYVYECSGYAPTGDYMWSYTGASASSASAVQRYKISAIPFSLPLQNGQQYAFQFWSPGAAQIYEQPLSVNPLTITIYLPCSRLNVTNPAPVINATCNTNTISNSVTCQGIDTQNYVNLWQISITYHPTIFTTQTLATIIKPGSSFIWTYQLPNHTTVYYVSINATIGRNIDPLFSVMSNFQLFSLGYIINPTQSYDAIFGILLFFIFIGVAYINEVAAMIGFPFIMILGNQLGIFQFASAYIYGSVGLMILIAALMLIFRD